LKIFIADDKPESLKLLKDAVERRGWEAVGTAATLDGFLKTVFHHEPDVILISIAFLALLSPEDEKQLGGVLPSAVIIAVSDNNDHEELKWALRYGARDLIALSQSVSEILATIERYHRAAEDRKEYLVKQHGFLKGGTELPALEPVETKICKTVVFAGSKGGVGTTFIASHVAGLLAAHSNAKVIYADMSGPIATDVTLHMTAEKPRQIKDLTPVLDELGTQHIENILARHASGFEVVRLWQSAAFEEAVNVKHIARVIELVAEMCDVLVIDCGIPDLTYLKQALRHRCSFYIVTTLNISSLRSAVSLSTSIAHSIQTVSELSLISNRYDGKVSLSSKDLNKIYLQQVISEIPEDLGTARLFEEKGKMLTDRPDLAVIRGMADIAARIYPFEMPEPKRFRIPFVGK
jgi:pilus assembly protein CpaE